MNGQEVGPTDPLGVALVVAGIVMLFVLMFRAGK